MCETHQPPKFSGSQILKVIRPTKFAKFCFLFKGPFHLLSLSTGRLSTPTAPADGFPVGTEVGSRSGRAQPRVVVSRKPPGASRRDLIGT